MIKSEFSELLLYLEEQNNKKKSSNENSTTENKKEEKFEDFLDLDTTIYKKVKKSKGFDIKKLESLMIKKTQDSHNKLMNYERPYISVTELCGCLRKSYFFRLKYKETNQFNYPYLDIITHIGSEVHKYVLNLYDFDDVEKVVLSDNFKIKGRIDGSINKQILVELKTEDTIKFNRRKTYVKQHYQQALIYSYILNNEYNYNISTITLVYILRNLKNFIPFDLEYNEIEAKKLVDNALILYDHIKNKKLIDPINSNSDECNFCPYKKLCKDSNLLTNKHEKLQDKRPVFLL